MPSDTLLYSQGQTATITASFVTSPAGMPIDVPDATIQIFGPSASVVLGPTPMIRVMTGFYFYDYNIPTTMPVNVYTVMVSGTVVGVPTQMSIYLQVLPAGTRTPVSMTQRTAELIVGLERYIGCAQQIPVYHETGRVLVDRRTFQLTWPRWNLGNHVVYLNNNIVNTDYNIDLDTGSITFDAPLHETDTVAASYNFRFFTQMEEVGFITDAIDQINIEPPQSKFTIDSFPDQWVGVLMQGAAKNAIKRLLLCLAFQQPATVFGGPDRVKDAISTFQALKENYEKEFERDKKTAKSKQPYPKIGVVVQPEYTLPGGRSRWFRYLFSTNVG
jgi:hypothetical protein